MPEVSEMVWNDFFSHFSLNADGSRSYDGVQVKRNAVFADAKGHWAQNAIENTVAEGLFSSVTDTSFTPNASATRGMLMTVLARYAGTDTTGGATRYEKGMEWAKTNGVSDGTNPTPTSPVSSSSPCCTAMRMSLKPAAHWMPLQTQIPSAPTRSMLCDGRQRTESSTVHTAD